MHFKASHLGSSTVGVGRGGGVGGGAGGVGERGQEIGIRVINNFCSVIKQRDIGDTCRSSCPPLLFSSLRCFLLSELMFTSFCNRRFSQNSISGFV